MAAAAAAAIHPSTGSICGIFQYVLYRPEIEITPSEPKHLPWHTRQPRHRAEVLAVEGVERLHHRWHHAQHVKRRSVVLANQDGITVLRQRDPIDALLCLH